jgi:uncharacterized protein (TIGR02594 family)
MSRWSREYNRLPPDTRAALNELINEIFRDQTNFRGKIDPKKQPDLAAKWIEIRDQVMANRDRFSRWLRSGASVVADKAQALPIFRALDKAPDWIRVARREIGTHESAGSRHNPRIMQYIRTCTNIQKTEAQRRYVERAGEEGVEWCSAFVNWCLRQAGITGTNNALASSWKNWGGTLTGPKCGAIVCFSWAGSHRIDHVAFCDEVGGKFKRLGGNQRGSGGQVSSVPFSRAAAKHYRWPVEM